MLPRISIITPSYNQGDYIEETILSVLNQRYDNLEYIVIDGGSQDNSRSIIERYSDRIYYWISENDSGQVDAINKGIRRSTGQIVAFLNSDDLYLPGALSAVSKYFNTYPDCSWLCGDTVMFGSGHKTELYRAKVPTSVLDILTWQAHSPQPGMFWKRNIIGDGFDENYNYCFDHEFYLRLLLSGYKCEHLSLPVAAYRLHEHSKTVADSERFDIEFDAIAEKYEPRLDWRSRNLSRATRYIRESYKLANHREIKHALSWLIKALISSPEVIFKRPFWGTFRLILTK